MKHIILANPVSGKKKGKIYASRVQDLLKKNNINVTIRKEFGKGIDAACGQLRAKEVNKE